MVQPEEWAGIRKQLGLSQREGEVVMLLFEGSTCEAAARKLNIKPRTVRQYVEQVHTKLAIKDRVELALLVIECRDSLRGSESSHDKNLP